MRMHPRHLVALPQQVEVHRKKPLLSMLLCQGTQETVSPDKAPRSRLNLWLRK